MKIPHQHHSLYLYTLKMIYLKKKKVITAPPQLSQNEFGPVFTGLTLLPEESVVRVSRKHEAMSLLVMLTFLIFCIV